MSSKTIWGSVLPERRYRSIGAVTPKTSVMAAASARPARPWVLIRVPSTSKRMSRRAPSCIRGV